MAEAANQLNLGILTEENDGTVLIPSYKKKPFLTRSASQIVFSVLIVIGLISTLVRWLVQEFTPSYYPPVLFLSIILMLTQRERIGGRYHFDENHLHIPYTWFYKRKIPIGSILSVSDDSVIEETTGQKYAAIRIFVDSSLIKLNITGRETSNILLSTMVYDSNDLNRFADELVKLKRQNPANPNTLAQRLTDQVDRAWKKRWFLLFFNLFDSTSESLIFLLIFESIIFGIFGVSIWPVFGLSLLGIYIFFALISQLYYKPQAIVGIRPHELGPLIYNEEELMTSVRFISISHPYTLHLRGCELIYPEDANKQVGRLQQIQPQYIPPGELTYGVAQIIGNHTKAIGADIQFTYKEIEDKRNVIYEVRIEWGT